ncbi:MAG: MFS transporter [Sedimenticola sp.]|nr:MAG: MFS transporter [Sedimenticola sp.]
MEKNDTLPLHYAWLIVISGVLILHAVLGLGRFALGMLLPSMATGLELGFDQIGLIGTFNFTGYLLAVVVAGKLTAAFGYRSVITAGILIVACSMVMVSQSQNFAAVSIALAFQGIGSGLANVPLMGLVSHWFHSSRRGQAAGLLMMGNSLGIILSGALVPLINQSVGVEGWRVNWQIFSLIAFFTTLLATFLLRNSPADKGLTPLGQPSQHPPIKTPDPAHATRIVLHIGAIYFLFGFSYVIYATFIVTSLVNDYQMSEKMAGQFWLWIGAISLVSGPVFGALSDRIGRKKTMILVFTLLTCAYLLVALTRDSASLYLSVLLFGLCVWSIPPIIAVTVADYLGMERAVTAIGLVTLFFGIGQISGPALAGMLADSQGSFAPGFMLAGSMTATAIVLTALLKKPKYQPIQH